MGHIRGNEIAMILQEPMASLNPLLSIGRQIMEGVQLREGASKQQAKARAVELLSHVGIAGAEQKVDDYPYQFSGGMQQRAMIAVGLACNPSLLIADEPTTALDVTIEAQTSVHRIAAGGDSRCESAVEQKTCCCEGNAPRSIIASPRRPHAEDICRRDEPDFEQLTHSYGQQATRDAPLQSS